MKCLVYCKAGGSTGLGHLSRCLSLAGKFEKNGISLSFLIEIESDLNISFLSYLQNQPEVRFGNFELLISNIHSFDPDFVVLDAYNIQNEHIELIQNLGVPVIHFNDYLNETDPSAFVICTGLPENNQIRIAPYGQIFKGHQYTPLNPVFEKKSSIRSNSDKIYDLVITMGGADNNKIAPRLVEWIDQHFQGLSMACISRYQNKCNQNHIETFSFCTPEALAEIYAKSIKGIFPVSVSAAEALQTGLPTGLILTADNQLLLKKSLTLDKNACFLGSVTSESENLPEKNLKKWISEDHQILHEPVRNQTEEMVSQIYQWIIDLKNNNISPNPSVILFKEKYSKTS